MLNQGNSYIEAAACWNGSSRKHPLDHAMADRALRSYTGAQDVDAQAAENPEAERADQSLLMGESDIKKATALLIAEEYERSR